MQATDQTSIAEWRRRLLRPILNVATVVAAIATACLLLLPRFRTQWSTSELVALVAFGLMLVVVSFGRWLPDTASGLLFIAGSAGICVVVIAHTPFSRPNVYVALELLVTFVVLLVGSREAWVALVAALCTLTIIAGLHVSGVLTMRMAPLDPTSPEAWLGAISIFGGLTTIAIGTLSFIVRRLEQEIVRSRALHDEVQAQSKQAIEALEERQQLEQRLAKAEKLEALGTLAGGLAHDFNSLLSVITANLTLVKSATDRGASGEMLNDALAAAERGAALTHDLLALSTHSTLESASSKLAEQVANALVAARRLLPEPIAVALAESDDTLYVNAAERELEQVVVNLIVNARDALSSTANARIDVSVKAVTGVTEFPGVTFGMLAIKDNGVGMNDATRARLFEPFFTTKDRSKASGLGLPVVHGIATARGGFVEVDSAPERGSEVRVYFPLAKAPADTHAAPKPSVVKHGKRKTVLIAEDEPTILKLIDRVLKNAGYATIGCSDGEQALLVLSERSDIDLVVTDVIMPNMDGRTLHDRAVLLRPELPFLFCSGYTASLLPPELFSRPRRDFLAKPFLPSALVEKAKALLA